MESKSGKITNITQGKQFTNNYGTFYGYYLTFDNGDNGGYTSKTSYDQALKFSLGDFIYYDFEKNGKYGKVLNPSKDNPADKNQGFTGGRKTGSNASFALSYAKDLACANISIGKDISAIDMCKVADKFLEWLNSNS